MRLMYRLICEWAQLSTTAVWVWVMTSIKETSSSVELPPDHSIVRLGHNVTFLCKSNFTKYEVNWLFSPVGRAAELVYNGKVERPYKNKIGGLEVNEGFKLRSELTIMNVQMDDAGLVYCSDEGGAGWPISASLSVVDGIKCSGTCDLKNDELVYICSTCYQTAILEDHSERSKLLHYLLLPNTTQVLPSRHNSDSFDSERNCNQMESYWLVKTSCSTFGNYLKVGVKDSSTNATMEAQFTIAVGELIEDSSTPINSNDATSEIIAKGIPEMVTKNLIGVIISVGIAIFLIVIVVILYCCRKRIRENKPCKMKLTLLKSARGDIEKAEDRPHRGEFMDSEFDSLDWYEKKLMNELAELMIEYRRSEIEYRRRARQNDYMEKDEDRLHREEFMDPEFDHLDWYENKLMNELAELMIEKRRSEIGYRRRARQNDYMEERVDLLHIGKFMDPEFDRLDWEDMKCIQYEIMELMIENERRARQNDDMEPLRDTDRNINMEKMKLMNEELSKSRWELTKHLHRHKELIKSMKIDLGLHDANAKVESLLTKDHHEQDKADLLHRGEFMDPEFDRLDWEDMKCMHYEIMELMIKNLRRARQNDYMEPLRDTDRNINMEKMKLMNEKLSKSRRDLTKQLHRHKELIKSMKIDLGLHDASAKVESLLTKDHHEQPVQEAQTVQEEILIDIHRSVDPNIKESDEYSNDAAGVYSRQLFHKFNVNDDSCSKNNVTIGLCSSKPHPNIGDSGYSTFEQEATLLPHQVEDDAHSKDKEAAKQSYTA